MADQQKLQILSEEFQKLQTDLQSHVTAHQRLQSQLQENRGVATEFTTLADDAKIYKLVGPVLLPQERTEAQQTVDGRLTYIKGELKRLDALIREVQEGQERKKTEIYQIQVSMQQQQQRQQQGQEQQKQAA